MNILVAARLNSEYKLKTTLDPIIDQDFVEKVYIVRRDPIQLSKTICYSPPGILRRFILTTELYRLFTIFYLCLFKKIHCLMGIHFILHCVYTALAKMVFRIPLIMLIIENPKKYKGHALFKFFIRRADLIGVRGQRSKQYIATMAGIDAKRIFVTPDVHDFQKSTKQMQDKKIYDLIFVGYYTKAKRIDVLLEVVKEIQKTIPKIQLAIIGDGPLKDMVIKKIMDLGLEKNVHRIGYVESIYPYLCQSRAFIMTSQTEGLPTVLLEAMGCGLPFIVPDVGDIPDLAIHEYNALVVPSLDVGRFAEACCQLLTDDKLYHRLVGHTYQLLEDKQKVHTIENVSKIWNERLNEIIGERK